MKVLEGKKVASQISDKLQKKFEKFESVLLVIVLIGNDFASEKYINFKIKTGDKLGVTTKLLNLPSETTEKQLTKVIKTLNNDRKVNGYLIQLPLPKQINVHHIFPFINPSKDVDGLSIINAGALFQGNFQTVPATPRGIMELLDFYKISLSGKVVGVVGRSNIVGKPLTQLLLKANATVIACHSFSDLKILKTADIIISATGSPHLITKELVKKGAYVIDVGIKQTTNKKIIGDVDYNLVKEVAAGITPMPGGVGPMTVIALFENLYDLVVKQSKK